MVAAWRASGISTPLFRKTSCGVAYTHQAPDYNGHWGVREICDICPLTQQQRCAHDYQEPTPADLDRVMTGLGYASPRRDGGLPARPVVKVSSSRHVSR